MAKAGIEVKGAKELRRTMKQAGLDMADLKVAHGRVAEVVARAADPPKDSGALAASVRSSGQAAKAVVRAGGARARYAGVQEYGWPARNIRACRYLTTAIERTRVKWFDMYVTEVQGICDNVRGM